MSSKRYFVTVKVTRLIEYQVTANSPDKAKRLVEEHLEYQEKSKVEFANETEIVSKADEWETRPDDWGRPEDDLR